MGQLLRLYCVEDLYIKRGVRDQISYERGKIAETAMKRISDSLAAENLIETLRRIMWTEERSKNHHPHIITPLWPVGLITLKCPAQRADEILRSRRLEEYNFVIDHTANSSGGILSATTDRYEFSTSYGNAFRSYHDAAEEVRKLFEEKEEFQIVGEGYTDYMLLRGDDDLSQAIIYLEIGNIPLKRKNTFLRGLYEMARPSKKPKSRIPKKDILVLN